MTTSSGRIDAGGLATCRRHPESTTWGRSPVCFDCLVGAQLLVTAEGEPTDPRADGRKGSLFAARYRFKAVKCGKKDCHTCPHYHYCYREWRASGKARSKYIGPVEAPSDPYELPELRPARSPW